MRVHCFRTIQGGRGWVWEVRENDSHRPIVDTENKADAELIVAAINAYASSRMNERGSGISCTDCRNYQQAIESLIAVHSLQVRQPPSPG